MAFHGLGITAVAEKKGAGYDPTNGSSAASRRAETNITRKRQAHEWDERHGKLIDLAAFRREILPLIQDIPLSRLQRATGLSLRYVILDSARRADPAPKAWQGLLAAARR